MPEITFDQLPQLLEENKKIREDMHILMNSYLQNYHPKGWNRIDGAKKFIEQNHYLIQAPVHDSSFGGFIRTTNTNKHICYINTAQPRMYQNFVLFHELYHLISLQKDHLEQFHLVNAGVDYRMNERKADYFASLLLIDEYELRSFFTGPENKGESLFTKILLCMFAFKAPYKAVLIRLYELGLIEFEDLRNYFDRKIDFFKEFASRGLDTYILEKSGVVNFQCLETLMDEYPLPTVAQNSNKKLFEEIKDFFSDLVRKENSN